MIEVSASCYNDQIIKPFPTEKRVLQNANVKRSSLNPVGKTMVSGLEAWHTNLTQRGGIGCMQISFCNIPAEPGLQSWQH